jgi:hypothetical protein
MNPTEIMALEKRARDLHDWFCKETGQNLPWTVVWHSRWEQWLAAGHNGPQLRSVLLYRRKQVSFEKRNMRCLTLLNLIGDEESFQADLGLVQMRKAGKLDVDAKIALPPDAVKSSIVNPKS